MTPMDSHPSRDQLAALGDGCLPPSEAEAVETHVAACDECAATLEALGAGDDLLSRLRSAIADDPDQTWVSASTPRMEEPIRKLLEPPQREGSLGRLGHYEVLEFLGRGAFGVVLRAFDETLERIVAVKVLAPEMAATSPARKRFQREARKAAQVRHENVVQIYAVHEQPIPFLVMEYIPGQTLQQRLDGTGPLDAPDVVRFGLQMARGLAAAHAQGLIHRDIKPGNILIEKGPQERVKITDFGLARAADDASLTQSGLVAGTPMFMAPEQARGETIDQRADLFSLGSVLYTMTTGRPPFRASGTVAVLKRVCDDTPRNIQDLIPETPDWLCELIARLHAKRPEDRIQTADEVGDLLDTYWNDLQHGRLPTPATKPSKTADRPDKKNVKSPAAHAGRRRWLTAAAVLLILLAGLGLAEATGVTQLTATVVRLTTGAGVLAIETNDPEVRVLVDGEEIKIRGAGMKELTLRPGKYRVAATKDGKQVQQELVTIARGGRQVLRISLAPQEQLAPSISARGKAIPPGSSADILTSDQYEWTEPENLGPPINTDGADGGPFLSPDGLTLIFHSDRHGGSGDADLWIATRPSLDAGWETPQNLGPKVNSPFSETNPCLSADGLTLIFGSDRPQGMGGADLWIATRQSATEPWPQAVNLGEPVNSEGYDGGPALSADGLTLVFNSARQEGEGFADLWRCSRPSLDAPWSAPQNVGAPVNSPTFQGWAALADDGFALIFNSSPSPGVIGGLLWVSTRASPGEAWSTPVRFQPEDQKGAWSPCLSGDATTLLFDSKRAGGHGGYDIWMSRRVRKTAPIPIALPPGSSAEMFTSDEYEWTEAENLGPLINTEGADGGPFLSADGLMLIFHSNRNGGVGGTDLWISTRPSLDGDWGAPENLGSNVNSPFFESNSCLSADGLTLIFGSDRPPGMGSSDLWMATRPDASAPWSPAVSLGASVNSEGADAGPVLSADGLTLVFNSDRKGCVGISDLWQCSRKSTELPWSPAQNLGAPINSSAFQGWAALAHDGTALIFNSNRTGGPIAGPLWMCTRPSPTRAWSTPIRLQPNEPRGAWSPGLSADATTLLFDSRRPGGYGDFDIWRSRRVRKTPPSSAPKGAALDPSRTAPPRATAPFTAEETQQHQEAWAEHLGAPVEYTNSIGMTFRLIPPGEFLMGSTPAEIEEMLQMAGSDERWRGNVRSEGPQHKVILTQAVYLGVHEVTQKNYETVMGTNPSFFAKTGTQRQFADRVAGLDTANHPVENVSWNAAAEFCAKLSQRERLAPSYSRTGDDVVFQPGTGYRLPTEAEWEFACRAGTTTRFWCGDRDDQAPPVAWIRENSSGRTHPVGELKPNPFGLYDVHGHVWEWVQDWWAPDYYAQFGETQAVDPAGPPTGARRVIRGGHWAFAASICRSSDRFAEDPLYRSDLLGFRVALPVEAVEKKLAAPRN